MNLAEYLHGKIIEKIPSVNTCTLARQASDRILKEFPKAEGADRFQVLRHIKHHAMHPGIRLTEYIRDLHGISERLKLQMQAQDPETGHSSVDLNTAKVYMSAVTQISTLYRIGDLTKLTFGSMK